MKFFENGLDAHTTLVICNMQKDLYCREQIADIIRSFPTDTIWDISGSERNNKLSMSFVTKLGLTWFSLMAYPDCQAIHIWSTRKSSIPTTLFFNLTTNPPVYFHYNEHMLNGVTTGEIKLRYINLEKIIKEINNLFWSTPMKLESKLNWTMAPNDLFEKHVLIKARKYKNRAYFIDAFTNETFWITSGIVSYEKLGSGCLQIRTESGHLYSLTL